ncbi:MAG: hypothetical protein JNM00_02500, partial [Flavobacteriales bacterium]|nr:hypothetical protein [Flavobacteriales bacterium]
TNKLTEHGNTQADKGPIGVEMGELVIGAGKNYRRCHDVKHHGQKATPAEEPVSRFVHFFDQGHILKCLNFTIFGRKLMRYPNLILIA